MNKLPICVYCGCEMEMNCLEENDRVCYYVSHFCGEEQLDYDYSVSFSGPVGCTEEEAIKLANEKLYNNTYHAKKRLEGVS